MELNLLPILNFDGKKMSISEDVDLTPSKDDTFSVVAPVHIDAVMTNIGGTIELDGCAKADIRMVCDRCAEEYDTAVEFEIAERLKKEDAFSDENEDPDIISFVGTHIDLSEIIYTNLFMNLPTKSLCSDDCKGLCPVCGVNLNRYGCDCNTETTDPRFDILDQLL